ncbi:hypothetical protein ACFE04_020381 [Oxalis oulophora]
MTGDVSRSRSEKKCRLPLLRHPKGIKAKLQDLGLRGRPNLPRLPWLKASSPRGQGINLDMSAIPRRLKMRRLTRGQGKLTTSGEAASEDPSSKRTKVVVATKNVGEIKGVGVSS